ncbi:MAG: RNA binding motif protein 22, partial [Paramarteilia canceri]
HEKPTDPDDPLSEQNISDRFHGRKDPVAMKLLNTFSKSKILEFPEDKSITTLFFSGFNETITKEDFVNALYMYGEIRKIDLIRAKNIAFVEFVNRKDAETALQSIFKKFVIKDVLIQAKFSIKETITTNTSSMTNAESQEDMMIPVPGLPLPHKLGDTSLNQKILSPSCDESFTSDPKRPNVSQNKIFYPSQNPNQLGKC